MEEEIMVSICCLAYNHGEYIKQALDGFLMQKTKFKYEVIINDDASTDNTADIIREYQKKYPDIIKPIFQTENQYKKTKRIFEFCFQKAKGKYIALCEGDDYWIDENKLQKQVDYMEANEGCTFCFHNAEILYMKSNCKEVFYDAKSKHMTKDNKYTVDQIHLVRDMPTASFFFRNKDVERMPRWCLDSICSDLPIKLIMTSYGYAYYLDEIMSVYRKETGISVTDTWNSWERKKEKEKIEEHGKKIVEIIENFDEYTNYQYSAQLQISKDYHKIGSLLLQEEYKQVLKNYKKEYEKAYEDKFCLKLRIKAYFPKLYKKLKEK